MAVMVRMGVLPPLNLIMLGINPQIGGPRMGDPTESQYYFKTQATS